MSRFSIPFPALEQFAIFVLRGFLKNTYFSTRCCLISKSHSPVVEPPPKPEGFPSVVNDRAGPLFTGC